MPLLARAIFFIFGRTVLVCLCGNECLLKVSAVVKKKRKVYWCGPPIDLNHFWAILTAAQVSTSLLSGMIYFPQPKNVKGDERGALLLDSSMYKKRRVKKKREMVGYLWGKSPQITL